MGFWILDFDRERAGESESVGCQGKACPEVESAKALSSTPGSKNEIMPTLTTWVRSGPV